MKPSDKNAVKVFGIYAVVQLVLPIALFRQTPAVVDALWFVGTIAPGGMALFFGCWFMADRLVPRGTSSPNPSLGPPNTAELMHRSTLLLLWLGLAALAALNLWIAGETIASC